MTKNKMLVGVVSTVFGVTCLLGAIPSYATSNNLPDHGVSKSAVQKIAYLVASSESKNEKILTKYENATSLTDSQLVELLKAVGFKGKSLEIAWAVAKSESNGRPFAFNGNANTGDSSFGIFQINMIGVLGPDRREKFDLEYNAALFNPVLNAQIVYKMTQGGKDWGAWKDAQTPSVKRWLEKFPQ